MARVYKYRVIKEDDAKFNQIGDLLETFRSPDGRLLYTLYFADGDLKGYLFEELEEPFRVIK